MCLRGWKREGCQQQESRLYLHSMWMHSSHAVPGGGFLGCTGSCSVQPWKEPWSGSRWNTTAPWKHISVSLGSASAEIPLLSLLVLTTATAAQLNWFLVLLGQYIHRFIWWSRGKGKIGIMEKEEKGFSLIGLLAYCGDKICTFYIRPLLAMHRAQRTKKALITRN